MRRCLQLMIIWFLACAGVRAAEGPAFDLLGPKVDVHVKRGTVTLPIGEVPNLEPGDRLWIHPDLPESQSTHFVLIVAFLRGATNPPPPEWFTRVETWNKDVRSEGVFVTVPAEAQQALVFLAPETGGDFSTLRAAVRGRPGAFVRATQDLQAASLDRMRLESYLAAVRVTSETDAALLKERAGLAARSLGVKVELQCFDKPPEQQASCLVQHTDGLVLDDSNAQSMVNQITTGATGDLMNQLSYSPMAGGGTFSPYVGAIVDTARILSSLHTAHFQYIPALALATEDTLNLRLNVPPSFRDPKSVVVALPPVGPTTQPPLHPVVPEERYCAEKPQLVLPAEGAPVVFSTRLAYGLTLHIETQVDGKAVAVDLPMKADPSAGGLVPVGPVPLLGQGDVTGVVRGKWGFDNWEGPHFHLHTAQPGKWALAAGEQSALVVGREDTLHLEDDSSLCVDRVEGEMGSGSPLKLAWKSPRPGSLEVAVPMQAAAPGPVTVAIYQYGLEKPDRLPLRAYAEAASLDRLTLSAGDQVAQLRGTRLDEVAKAELEGMELKPSTLSRVEDFDQLTMSIDGSTAGLTAGKSYVAKVQLQDGRQLKVPVTVDAPRPQVTLLNKGVQEDAASAPSPVRLGSADDLPLDERLVFFLKSRVPVNFPRNEKVEVAAVDGSFKTILSLSDGGLMLEDARTAVGTVEPLARFGASAFGPLQVRAMSADGVTGDWLPLGTLVRLPAFKELRCPRGLAKPCTLAGNNLFLAASVSASAEFTNAVDVPADFTGTQLSVPHPTGGTLYVRLRDDPDNVQSVVLPVTSATQSTAQAAAVAAQQAPPPAAAAPPAGTPDQPEKADSPATPNPEAPNR